MDDSTQIILMGLIIADFLTSAHWDEVALAPIASPVRCARVQWKSFCARKALRLRSG